MYVNESKFLELPDPPMDGIIENAWWSSNKSEIFFYDNSEVGAIVYPKHYFEGTATISCSYYYSYLGYDGYMHASQGIHTFYVTCKSVITTLHDSYVEIELGGRYTIRYTRGASSFGNPDITWESSNTNVATINSNGTVTAVGLGVATITCDPINGPKVYCEIRVCEKPVGGGSNDGGNGDNNENADGSAGNMYEQSIQRIDNLKLRAKGYLPK